jgi:peptidyl-prolyl cis-trans isomerase SurA
LKRYGIWFRVVAPASALLLLATLSACNKKQTSSDVVARVNGKAILRSEVDKYYNNQTSGAPQKPTGEAATSLRLNILKELIDNEVMMQRAEKLGLLATDAEVDNKMTEIKAPYTQEEFDRRLKDRALTVEDFKLDLRRTLTVQKVLNKEVTSKISITDADISAYYNEHKAEFNLIEPQYHLAQIVITAQPNPQVRNLKNSKAQNEGEARAKAQMIMNRLESGEDFADLATNYSEDPQTSSNGGDMGFAPESSLKSMATQEPATRDAVLRMKPGETSGILPVASGRQIFGYRIVKLLGKEPAGQRDLSDPRVQQAIREQLRDRREQLLKSAYYETVRDEARVENYMAQEILKSAK